ncbi:MAG TPA: GvpL/GvpF family gas vesicle protein [Kribbella sp.]|jgi:hypothetical protein
MTETINESAGCYLYGIAVADLELPADLVGLDGRPVEVVPYGGVAAVMSRLGLDRSVARRDDLIAHGQVLDAAAAAGAVIPVRFGSVLRDWQELVSEVLEPRYTQYETMLGELAGHAQFVVHVRYEEQQILTEVVAESPEIAALREQTRGLSEESSYRGRIRLGEMVAAAVEAKRDIDLRRVLAALEPFAAASEIRESGGLDQLVDVAFLVGDDRRADFEHAAEKLASELGGRARVSLVGPTAPYDFVGMGE